MLGSMQGVPNITVQNEAPYEVYVEEGEHTNRFSIVFIPVEDQTTEETDDEESEDENETDETDSENDDDTENNETDEGSGDNDSSEENEDGEWDESDQDESEEDDTDEDGQWDESDQEQSEEETDDTDTSDSDEETIEDDQEESQTDMEVIEVTSDVAVESLELTEMYAGYNSQNNSIIIRKNTENKFNSIRLYTMLGQVIRAWNPDKNATEIELPTSNVSTGVYILDIETTTGRMTKKLIIH